MPGYSWAGVGEELRLSAEPGGDVPLAVEIDDARVAELIGRPCFLGHSFMPAIMAGGLCDVNVPWPASTIACKSAGTPVVAGPAPNEQAQEGLRQHRVRSREVSHFAGTNNGTL